MKIAYILRHYHKRGGISRCAAALAERFARDNEVHVYAASWDDVENSNIKFHKVPILSFEALKKRKKYALNTLFEVYSFVLGSYFTVRPEEYDIVHSNGDYLGPLDVFTVHSCHKAWIELAQTMTNGKLLERFKKSILNPLHLNIVGVERHSLLNARRIISISRGIEKEITGCYQLDASRIVCLPNGVETKTFNTLRKAEDRDEIRRKYGISSDDFVLIFPAHEFVRKGLNEVLEALGMIDSDRLCLLVAGRDDPKPFLRKIEAARLKARVIFTGAVPDIDRYYAASDAMVFPTAYEPFGLIITEAMATGLPVIVTRSAGAAELITDGRDGLLIDDRRDTKAIKDAILALMASPEKREMIGREAQRTAERYSWDVIAEKTYRLYEEILSEKRKGRGG